MFSEGKYYLFTDITYNFFGFIASQYPISSVAIFQLCCDLVTIVLDY